MWLGSSLWLETWLKFFVVVMSDSDAMCVGLR